MRGGDGGRLAARSRRAVHSLASRLGAAALLLPAGALLAQPGAGPASGRASSPRSADVHPTAGAVPEADGAGPRVVRGPDGAWRLALPATMRTALAASLPRFRPWEARDYDESMRASAGAPAADGLYWATIVDLDGDGRPDAVLYGTDGPRELLVAVLTGGGARAGASMAGARVVVLDQAAREPGVGVLKALTRVRRGRQDACEGQAPVLPYDGVSLQGDHGGPAVYYLTREGRPASASTGC